MVSQLPAAPAGLGATADEAQIRLSWTVVAGATSYTVWRGRSEGGPYAAIGAVPTGTTYVDTAITNGVTYYYVVRAGNWNGESGNSSEVGAAAPLPVLRLSYSGADLVLTWPQSASDLKVYGASDLTPPVAWAPITNGVTISNQIARVAIAPGNQNMFFRLMSP